jgi:hypothetical protein
MGVAEHCTLILDGARLEKFTCAFERTEKAGIHPYGFLNGPVEMLRAARRAGRVELELESGEILEASVLEVNKVGLALIAVKPIRQ